MKTTILKRGAAWMAMAILCCFSFLHYTQNARAATVAQAVQISYPRDGDANDNGKWGHPAQTYLNGWSTGSTNVTTVFTMGSYEGSAVYCIEPGRSRNTGDKFTQEGEEFWDHLSNDFNTALEPAQIKKLIGRILYYGYHGPVSMEWKSQNAEDADKIAHILATQILVWETIVGERDQYFHKLSVGSKDPMIEYVQTGHPLYSKFKTYYDSMAKSVQKHTTFPSFMGTGSATVQLKWDGTAYTAKLNDTNKVVMNFSYTSDEPDVTFTKSSGTLTVKSTKRVEKVTVKAARTCTRQSMVVWSDGNFGPNSGLQDCVGYGSTIADPVSMNMTVETNESALRITKTAEDGVVQNVSFTITGEGITKTAKTNEKGVVIFEHLTPGNYTASETSVPEYYDAPSSVSVTLLKNSTMGIYFDNTLKKGNLQITKQSEDDEIENISFRVSGTSMSGAKVNEVVKTNEKGIATLSDIPISSSEGYTVEELNVPSYYRTPDKKTVSITKGKTTKITISNVLKKGNLNIVKTSEDGRVKDVYFCVSGITLNGIPIEITVKTDEEGVATITDLPIADKNGYTVEEVNTPLFYIPLPKQVATILDNKTATITFENKLKRGNLQITKESEDNLIENISFRIFGKALNGTEIDQVITTNETGKAVAENILISNEDGYQVEELNIPNFDVTQEMQKASVSEKETTEILFQNRLKKGSLKIIKESEDGQIENVSFRVTGMALNGEPIDFVITTNENGEAMAENILISNEEGYQVEELNVPEYDVEPATQTIDLTEGNCTEITFQNVLKRGSLLVTKESEDGQIEHISFHITGTSLKGDLVDEVMTTDEKGMANFSNLLISDEEGYTVEEMNVPEFDTSQEVKKVNILYQETTEVAFQNTLKRGSLKVKKEAEDGQIAHVVFHVKGIALNGEEVDVSAETNEEGEVVFENLLVSGSEGYLVEEVDPNSIYVTPDSQTIFIVENETTTCTFQNRLKRFGVTVKKVDKQTKKPLKGAVFGIFDTSTEKITKEKAIQIVKTNEEGMAVFSDMACGKYVIAELEAPTGYTCSDAPQTIEICPDTTEYMVTFEDTKIVIPIKETPYTKTPDTGDASEAMVALLGTLPIGALLFLRKQKETTI